MSATLSTPRARSRLARPLAFIGLAIVLALGALMAQAAISMAAAAGGANPAEPAAYVVAPALPPAAGPVATVRRVPTKVIRVSIARQELTAYENGVSVLTTVVATGQPALPTPRGSFQVMGKYTPYTFISPWPKGDPFWYPTVTVSWALLFANDGFFLHDSPHRTLYGPDSNLINGTHGCVNVPTQAMATLYRWADVGTTVVIE